MSTQNSLSVSSSALVDLLRDYSQAHGASGHEDAVRVLFTQKLRDTGAVFAADRLGGVLATWPSRTGIGAGPRVMLTAHMDEVGFMVQHVTAEGFLQFVPLGGWNEGTLLAQRVRVLTRKGREFAGVIASVPKHFAGKDGGVVPIERMAIDIGAVSRAQVESWGVQIGDSIVPDGPFTVLGDGGLVMGKAFDNRAGMTVLTAALETLARETTPNQVLGVATVQEEVGVRGAETAVALARPDVAIVLEGPPADDSWGFNRSEAQGRLGGGVQIRVYDPSAIMNRELVALARMVAQEEDIAHQVTVRRTGGTDARGIQRHDTGVPVIVLGVPARYIHSHHAILSLDDLTACMRLTLALTRRLDAEAVAKLTRYL